MVEVGSSVGRVCRVLVDWRTAVAECVVAWVSYDFYEWRTGDFSLLDI